LENFKRVHISATDKDPIHSDRLVLYGFQVHGASGRAKISLPQNQRRYN